MTNDNLHASPSSDPTSTPMGIRFQSAREALGMDRKDVAAQLRLHEKIITMIESGEFKTDLPLTFIRGYIRNYAKLLSIPEHEIKEGLDLLQPKKSVEEEAVEQAPAPAVTTQTTTAGPISTVTHSMPISIGNFFMQLFTYLIAITLIGLVGIWWHSHRVSYQSDNQALLLQSNLNQPAAKANPAIDNESSKSPVQTAAPQDANTLTDSNTTLDASSDNPSATLAAGPAPGTSVENKSKSVNTGSSGWESINKLFARTNNPGNKALLTHFVTGDYYLQSAIHFGLFVLLIAMCLRKYASYAHASGMMASATRLHRRPRQAAPRIKISNIVRLSEKFRLSTVVSLIAVIAVATLIGMGGTWWYKHAKFNASKSTPATAAPVVVEKKPDPGASLQLDADIETLAPSFNFGAAMMSAFKVNAMQAMVNQMNDLVNQAADTKFALTDPSTPIGQFTYKKKIRRYHRYYRTYDENPGSDPYNDQTDTNND